MRLRILLAAFLFLLNSFVPGFAQSSPATPDSTIHPVAAPTSVIVEDIDYDTGTKLRLTWVPSIDDQLLNNPVSGYRIYRHMQGSDSVTTIDLPAGTATFVDDGLNREHAYSYVVAAVANGQEYASLRTQFVSPEQEWINFDQTWLFIIMLIVGGSVVYFIETARRGKKLFVRKIAGLEAVDEAVGRATEMGRPILFIPGIQDMNDVGTIAGLTILGRVSRVVADYDTRITVPNSRSLVMTAARETIKGAYQMAGRPDAYSDDMATYITDEQFGYVAAVDGMMLRDRPATCFFMGTFWAEALILAETGHSVGAIQIAGTAQPTQIPFFVAACDFTLIGEELFAASAYLSGEPKQLGSLKGQDVGKGILLVVIVIGTIATTASAISDAAWIRSFLNALTTIFTAN